MCTQASFSSGGPDICVINLHVPGNTDMQFVYTIAQLREGLGNGGPYWMVALFTNAIAECCDG